MSGMGGDVCEELRKRMIDMCCLQEVRWRGHGTIMLGMIGGRYKLWLSVNRDEFLGCGCYGEGGAV